MPDAFGNCPLLSGSLNRKTREVSASNATHAAAGECEVGFADVMTLFFFPDHAAKIFLDLSIARAAAKARAQVMFDDAKEAGADFPVRREPDAIAMATER